MLTGEVLWQPRRLAQNSSRSYQGSNVLGLGFVLDDAAAVSHLRNHPQDSDVLCRYLVGEDVNSDPESRPSRWVINFRDWPLNRQAKGSWKTASASQRNGWLRAHIVPSDYPGRVAGDYPDALALVIKNVKPERAQKKRAQYRDIWWQFAEKQKALYFSLGRGSEFASHDASHSADLTRRSHVVCQAMISKYLAMAVVPNDMVFSHRLVVFTVDPSTHFAVLQSSIHEVWVRKYGGTLETRMAYTPTDAFETFPLPEEIDSLVEVGEHFLLLRCRLQSGKQLGLTSLYNQFHNPKVSDTEIEALRRAHVALDVAVTGAYGWSDIVLEHDFHLVPYLPDNDRLRFTISESSRMELLRRLGDLNRIRYEAEVRDGLHGPVDAGLVDLQAERRRRAMNGRMSVAEAGATQAQTNLDFEEPPLKVAEPRGSYDAANGAARSIRDWLVVHRGWHAKEEILAGAHVDPDAWPSAIRQLLETGAVAKQGERRGTKYSGIQP